MQNKGLDISSWSIKTEQEAQNGNGWDLVVWMDCDSAQCVKEKTDLNFGLGKVFVRNEVHFKNNEKSKATSGADKPASL